MTDIQLSEREKEILRYVATGASNKEISRDLHISINTVKVHLRNIFAKLDVVSRTEAAMWAVQKGLVDAGRDDAPSQAAVGTGNNWPSRWIKLIPSRVRPWIFVGLVMIFFVIGFGINLAITRSREEAVSEEIISLVNEAEQSRWQQLSDMPTARAGLAAAAFDSQIYAIAGEGFDGVTGVVERYDPPSDSWESLKSKPLSVADVRAGVIGGKIYVPGGRLADGEITDTLEIYDPRKDSWSRGASLPAAISAYAIAAFEGKIIIFGGWDGENHLDTVYEYDPSQNTWSERTPMPTARSFAGAAVAGEKIYLVGGYDGENTLDVNEEYTPALDSGVENPWRDRTPMPAGRFGFGIKYIGDTIVVFGGENDSTQIVDDIEFSLEKNIWSVFENPFDNVIWSDLSVVRLGNKIFFFGGNVDGTQGSFNYSYIAIYTVSFPIVGK